MCLCQRERLIGRLPYLDNCPRLSESATPFTAFQIHTFPKHRLSSFLRKRTRCRHSWDTPFPWVPSLFFWNPSCVKAIMRFGVFVLKLSSNTRKGNVIEAFEHRRVHPAATLGRELLPVQRDHLQSRLSGKDGSRETNVSVIIFICQHHCRGGQGRAGQLCVTYSCDSQRGSGKGTTHCYYC